MGIFDQVSKDQIAEGQYFEGGPVNPIKVVGYSCGCRVSVNPDWPVKGQCENCGREIEPLVGKEVIVDQRDGYPNSGFAVTTFSSHYNGFVQADQYAGTNCPGGGDGGHGGRTVFGFSQESGNFDVMVDGAVVDDFHSIEITARGDDEHLFLVQAFRYWADVIEAQEKRNKEIAARAARAARTAQR